MIESVKSMRERNNDYELTSLRCEGLEEQLFEVDGINGARVELDVRVSGIHRKCDIRQY